MIRDFIHEMLSIMFGWIVTEKIGGGILFLLYKIRKKEKSYKEIMENERILAYYTGVIFFMALIGLMVLISKYLYGVP